MKLTSRGFTLVELMIVIAIIGILAAALFPSMTGYLKRSRDAARTSHLKDITTAAGAFYSDRERYPNANPTTHCIGESSFTGTNYFPKGFPLDPQDSSRNNGVNGCTTSKQYGYNTGSIGTSNTAGFQFAVYFENSNGGNTGATATQALTPTNYAVDFASNPTNKGSGPVYLIGN